MFRHPDGTYKTNTPSRVEYNGYTRKFADLTREQWNEIGYNEAVPLKRESFTTYETQWVKGEDLIYREEVVNSVVDEAARYKSLKSTMQKEITEGADAVLAAIAPEYGSVIRETWETQSAEAELVLAGALPEAEAVNLAAMVAKRVEVGGKELTVTEQAQRVHDNRTAWSIASHAMVGLQNGYQDQLDDAVSMVVDENGDLLAEPDYSGAIVAIEGIDVIYA